MKSITCLFSGEDTTPKPILVVNRVNKRARSAAGFVATCVLLVGCASHRNTVVLAPIGPPPYSSPANPTRPGMLVVFSAFDSSADFNRSPYRRRYTDYQVFSYDGSQLVRRVTNDRGALLDAPKNVELAPGSYRVVARANGYGSVTVPVVIHPSQTTTVHLEGSVWWPRSSPIFDSDPVRLPGGEIAGWRAATATATSR